MDQKLTPPSHELPKPQPIEAQPQSGEYLKISPENIENSAPGERIAQAAQAVAQVSTTSDPQDPAGITQDNPSVTQDDIVASSVSPSVADDVNVIEKVWVEKAKGIVAKTKDDPRQQSIELTNFKHDYVKKRYGKSLKLQQDKAT